MLKKQQPENVVKILKIYRLGLNLIAYLCVVTYSFCFFPNYFVVVVFLNRNRDCFFLLLERVDMLKAVSLV